MREISEHGDRQRASISEVSRATSAMDRSVNRGPFERSEFTLEFRNRIERAEDRGNLGFCFE